jgi:glycosyltransferase involved in cell wall biosynthesis
MSAATGTTAAAGSPPPAGIVPGGGPLPRLLYVGDQPVESTVASATWFHRLLSAYPADRLRIIESNLALSRPDRRLPGVEYGVIRTGIPALRNTRFHVPHFEWAFRLAPTHGWQLRRVLREFRPDAILSIAHLSSWRTAAAVARRQGLPLHLVVHDDVLRMSSTGVARHAEVEAAFAAVYRQAASRLCISPLMEERFRARYGVRGDVLPPIRGPQATAGGGSPPPGERRSLVFAYTGSIYNRGHQGYLRPLALTLGERGHRLFIAGPLQQKDLATFGLDLPNVSATGFIPDEDFHATLRRDVDVLVVPMSFDPRHATDVQFSFPSKIADYTAVGLPLLVWGPAACSAVRWARDHGSCAEVIDDPSTGSLAAAVGRLEDPHHRRRLGTAAMTAGDLTFTREGVTETFHAILRRDPGSG